MDIEVGQIYRFKAFSTEYEVIGVNEPLRGSEQYWVRNLNSGTASTYGRETLEGATLVRPFFEKEKEYRSKLTGVVYTVWHVHQMAKGRVAIMQDVEGFAVMFTEDSFENFEEF